MDFLTDKIKPMYFKYLAAAFGSALISSIYHIPKSDINPHRNPCVVKISDGRDVETV